MRRICWRTGFGKIQHSCLAKFSSFRVGETERPFILPNTALGSFLLGAESFVKLTPGG